MTRSFALVLDHLERDLVYYEFSRYHQFMKTTGRLDAVGAWARFSLPSPRVLLANPYYVRPSSENRGRLSLDLATLRISRNLTVHLFKESTILFALALRTL